MIYVLIHGFFLLSVFVLAYSFSQKLSVTVLIELGLFVLISLLSLGLLLQRNRWAIWLEALRILILLSLIFLAGFSTAPGFVFGYLSLLVVAVSAVIILNAILYTIFSEIYEY